MHAIRARLAFDGERFLDGGATVLVEADRIAGVEPYDFTAPADVEVTTYDGTVLPGLIDAHVHLVADGVPGSLEAAGTMSDDEIDAVIRRTLRQQAAGGVTTVRDLGDRRYRTLGFRDARASGVPRIVAAGPPFTVTDGHCHYLGGAAEGPRAIRSAMAEHVERGVDVVKVMASGGMLTPGSDQLGVQFSAEDLRIVVDLAHEAGLQVLAHTHSLRGAWHALDARVDGLEHFTCLTEEGLRTPPDLLDAIAAAGIVIDPTIGWNRDAIRMGALAPKLRELMERLGLDPDTMRVARAEQLRLALEHGVRVVLGHRRGHRRSQAPRRRRVACGRRADGRLPRRARARDGDLVRRRRAGPRVRHRPSPPGARRRPARRRRRRTRRSRRPRAAGGRVRAGRGGATRHSRNRSPPRVAAWLR